jgi:hypothetical protein
MHTAKQPSYPECDEGSRIRLGFDCVAKCFLKASGSLARRIRRLTIKILGGAGGLIAFSLVSRIARELAETLSNLAKIAGGAFYAVLIHGRSLLCLSTCHRRLRSGTSRAASLFADMMADHADCPYRLIDGQAREAQ